MADIYKLKYNGRTLTYPGWNGYVAFEGPEPIVYDVILTTDGHGSITANPMSGSKDTLITLSNTPDQNYVFSKYTLNNVDLVGNTFLMPEGDAFVKGWFEADMRTITVTQPSHGTITAPASAQVGSTVNLSCTADSGYELEYFTVNGSQIQGNSFIMPASNVTVSASLVASAPTIDEVTIGTQTWMAKNLSIDDGQGGIYTQTLNYGQGDVVEYYYTWAAAIRVASSVQGWHLPSKDEWDILQTEIGGPANGTKLKSTYGWTTGNGTDNYGFAAFPAGYSSGGTFNYFQIRAMFWTSTEYRSSKAYCRYLTSANYALTSSRESKTNSYSVRLVKDS